MKTLKCTFILLFCFCYSLSYSQWHVGTHAGVSINDVIVSGLPDVVPDAKSFVGYSAGVQTEYDINPQFSVVSGLDYSLKGFMVEEGIDVNILGINVPLGVKAETRIKFVEMPIMGKYTFGSEKLKAYVMAGPSISYASSAQLKTKASVFLDFNVTTTDIDLSADTYNRTNIGGTVGAGIEVPNSSGKFFADIRYNQSFSNMLEDPVVDVKIKPRGVSLGIGYAMSF